MNYVIYRDRRIERQRCWLVAQLLVTVRQSNVVVAGGSISFRNHDSYRDRRIERQTCWLEALLFGVIYEYSELCNL